jgi:hypothetical protein
MSATGEFADACAAVGLRFRSEFSPHEPRFRLALEAGASPACLVLVVRGHGTIGQGPAIADPDLPGVLLTVLEETVRKEPVMDLWLAHTVHHRYVVWRVQRRWQLERVPDHAPAATPMEAVRQVLGAADDDPTPA